MTANWMALIEDSPLGYTSLQAEWNFGCQSVRGISAIWQVPIAQSSEFFTPSPCPGGSGHSKEEEQYLETCARSYWLSRGLPVQSKGWNLATRINPVSKQFATNSRYEVYVHKLTFKYFNQKEVWKHPACSLTAFRKKNMSQKKGIFSISLPSSILKR